MKNRSNYMLRIASVLLVLVLFSTSIVTGRLARYVTTDSGSDSSRVAVFNLTQSGVAEEDFMTHIAPGTEVFHTIEVQNLSEVAMSYTIQLVKESHNLPGMTFYMLGEDEHGTPVGTFDPPTLTFKDSFPAGSQKRIIQLKTSWHNPNPANAEKVDWIRILLTAEQID